MDNLKRKSSRSYVTRKAGQQPPAMVLELLSKRHPTVSLLWETKANRWCLVQTIRGKSQLICFLGNSRRYEAPTLKNTVYYLDSIHPSKLSSKAAIDKFIEKMDNPDEVAAAQKRARDRIRQGSNDLWNALNNRRVIPVRSGSNEQAQRP